MSASLSLSSNLMTDSHSEPGNSGSPITNFNPSLTSGATSKKPKLSLQTTSLGNTYGSLTRGLAADQQAIYTPTTTNTLANTWDLSYRPSPILRTESPKPPQLSRLQTQIKQEDQPYSLTLPFGIRSILKNSPLQARASSVSASPRESRRKLFFPQPKKVNFRRNLEDVIHTTRYVARHSDLSSSEDDSSSETASNVEAQTEHSSSQTSPPPTRKRKDRRDSGVSVDSTNTEEQSISSQDVTAVRPIKNCKRRKWQWSLPARENTSSAEQAEQQLSDECSSETQDEEDAECEQVSSPTELEEATEEDRRPTIIGSSSSNKAQSDSDTDR